MITHIGTITHKGLNGYYVEIGMNGQLGRYGPMQYVSTTREVIEYVAGDRVLVATVGRIKDNYLILGKVMDLNPPLGETEQPVIPPEEP